MAINELKRMIESGEIPSPKIPISDEIKTLSVSEREDLAKKPWHNTAPRRNARVTPRKNLSNIYTVIKIEGAKAICKPINGTETVEFDLSELIRI